jgi:hypothetical protein
MKTQINKSMHFTAFYFSMFIIGVLLVASGFSCLYLYTLRQQEYAEFIHTDCFIFDEKVKLFYCNDSESRCYGTSFCHYNDKCYYPVWYVTYEQNITSLIIPKEAEYDEATANSTLFKYTIHNSYDCVYDETDIKSVRWYDSDLFFIYFFVGFISLSVIDLIIIIIVKKCRDCHMNNKTGYDLVYSYDSDNQEKGYYEYTTSYH